MCKYCAAMAAIASSWPPRSSREWLLNHKAATMQRKTAHSLRCRQGHLGVMEVAEACSVLSIEDRVGHLYTTNRPNWITKLGPQA